MISTKRSNSIKSFIFTSVVPVITVILLPATDTAQNVESAIQTVQHPSPIFENDSSNYSSSGSIKLSWISQSQDKITAIAEFELERATTSDFSDAVLYYRGPDLATYISGLSNGNYYFRVREVRNNLPLSNWSPTVTVIVEHHSLGLAFTLFGLGGLVFILTLVIVVVGARRTDDPDKISDNSEPEQ